MARKISFLNFKGGVGKTSLVVNFASILAHAGNRVLLVDCDPQSNSSIWTLRLDRWNELQGERGDETLLSVLRPGGVPIRHAIQNDVVWDLDRNPVLPGLDLLSASFSLMDIEHEIEDPEDDPIYSRFYRQIATIDSDYDYIIFDCPPNLFKTTQCAVFSSEDIYAPANPDALSIIGFHLLVNKMLMFVAETQSDRDRLGAIAPQIRGVVLNAVKNGVNFEAPKQRLEIMIERFVQKRLVHRNAGILDLEIRHTILASRLVSQGIPAILSRDTDVITGILRDYKKVTDLIRTERISFTESAAV